MYCNKLTKNNEFDDLVLEYVLTVVLRPRWCDACQFTNLEILGSIVGAGRVGTHHTDFFSW